MPKTPTRFPGWIAGLLGYALASVWTPAQADWADLSRYGEVAEIAVESDEIRLNLRLAQNTVPEGLALAGEPPASPPPWLARRLPQLLAGNSPWPVGRFEFLRKVENGQDAYYEASLRYPLDKPLQALTIAPPAAGSPAAGLVVLHRGVPVSDLLPLRQTLKLTLDWHDPWRSRFNDPAFTRRHAEPRSYLYVEPYEIRHEVLLRLADIKPWLDLGLKDPRYVEAGEREGLQRKVGAFLAGRNPVRIDGAPAAPPQLDRVVFVRFQREGVVPVKESGRLDVDTALLGVVLTYLTENPARSVALRWDLFGLDAAPRQLSVIQGKETFDGYMSLKQPEFAWSQDESLEPAPAAVVETAGPGRQGRPPVDQADSLLFRAALLLGFTVCLSFALLASSGFKQRPLSAGLALLLLLTTAVAALPPRLAVQASATEPGRAGLDEAQAKDLLTALLHNAYRAFQLRDEVKTYDRLAKSLGGDLLDDIYLQQRRAVLRQAEGLGGEGKVDRIEVLESRVRPLAAAPWAWQVDARWVAHGTVSHWGHAHERHNLYQARLTLRPADGGQWKIVGLEFIGGQRLDAGASG